MVSVEIIVSVHSRIIKIGRDRIVINTAGDDGTVQIPARDQGRVSGKKHILDLKLIILIDDEIPDLLRFIIPGRNGLDAVDCDHPCIQTFEGAKVGQLAEFIFERGGRDDEILVGYRDCFSRSIRLDFVFVFSELVNCFI